MTTLETVRALVTGDAGLAMVSIARDDGSVHSSLVNAGITRHPVSGDEVVGFVVRGSAAKVRLLARNPQATVAWRVGWRWVAVEGAVELCGPDHQLDGFDAEDLPESLRQIFRDAGGSHDDWDEYDRVMAAERRTAVFVTPGRILGRN